MNSKTFEFKIKKLLKKLKLFNFFKNNILVRSILGYIHKKNLAKRKAIFDKYREQCLSEASNALKDLDIVYWIDCGTLLGAIRDNDFISHDLDIDIGVLPSDNDCKKEIELALCKRKFIKVREFELDGDIVEQTFLFNGATLDIFYYSENQQGIYSYWFDEAENYKEISKGTFKEASGFNIYKAQSNIKIYIQYMEFKNIKYPIPQDYNLYLKGKYGERYMIKDENWNPDKCPSKSCVYDKYAVCRLYNSD
ncbi:hypothetical protein JK636_04360 [Clostridium sp. YIM B02515]|uniref:LicD family protein n=1 Tax=Clostridium rhizosphaerae TaxID=2803861 RepID=A0ABS1TAF6_9CLOT|nr:hypothetical protein [Clostridium rhizosphaerae]MBL4934988.1 hypothetical protein [Clostridium rhizosphaerae]